MQLKTAQGFYCMDDAEFPTPEDAAMYEGCEIECQSNEILMVDPRNGGSWDCIPRLGPMPLICPGKFNTGDLFLYLKLLKSYFSECACNEGPDACPMGECACDGQLWVSHDCKAAK